MPTPTIFWNIDADGNWRTSADWNLHRLPNSTDDVSINTADLHTVTHGVGTDIVHTLTVGKDFFTVSGGSLTITSTSSFAHLLTVSGGTLKFGGAATATHLAQHDSTVSGAGILTVTGPATFTSTLLQTGSGRTVLEGGSTFGGSGNTFGLDGGRILENKGTFTLTGSAKIALGGDPFGKAVGGGMLKNDAGATIDIQGSNHITTAGAASSMVNDGLIEKTTLAGTAVIAASLTNTGTIRVEDGELDLSAVTNLSGTTLTGGIFEADAGAALLFKNAQIVTNDATLILSGAGSAISGSASVESSLTTIDASGTLEVLAGRDWSSTQAISNAGTLKLGGGTFAAASLVNTGQITGFGVIDTQLTNAGTIQVQARHALTLTGKATIAGTVDGFGTLVFGGGAQAIASGAALTVAHWQVDNNAAVTVNEVLTYAGKFSQSAGGILTVATGDGLRLTGDAALAGTVAGEGTLIFAGGTQALNSGGILTVGNWQISNGAAATVNEVLTYAGMFSQSAGGALTIGAGDKLRFTGGATLAGSVSGAGTLTCAGGTQAVNAGATLTVANWVISDTTILNESLTYSGGFILVAGSSALTVAAGDALSLTGAASLSGRVNGAGTVELSNATVAGASTGGASGLIIGGTATLSDVGTVHQTGDVTIGDGSSNAATLSIAVGSAYSISGANNIVRGFSAASIIRNSGLLIKSGAGTSRIGVKISNFGTVEAANGTLDFTSTITGAGALAVDTGATLEVEAFAASTLEMTFNGGGATLALADPASFKAAINAFGATDSIDLVDRTATAATLGAGDTLVIKNGATTIATLQLAGTYTGDTFHVASDGHGGTNITVTTPAAAVGSPGGGHQLIAAMASFAVRAAGQAQLLGDVGLSRSHGLAVPRLHIA